MCRIRAAFLAACFLLPVFVSAAPPVAGPNVNMVTGTRFPEGDPFLTKQNEPSIAVSSRNPRHLLAASNDYRQVAVLTAEGLRGGKAWNTLYKSLDGGNSWRSVVLGGCPIDIPACNDPTGVTAPLKAKAPDFSADPTVRAGPYGTFFYSFIAGRRDGSADGVVAVQRFVDKNNDIQRSTDLRTCAAGSPGCVAVTIPDGCTPGNQGCTVKNVVLKPAEDPIVPDALAIVATGSGGKFVDKPWNAADVPRSWNAGKSCELLSWTKNRSDVTNASETVPAFNVYASFANFAGNSADNEHPAVYVVVSSDCGKTFGKPIKISNPVKANSGTNIAIDPLTGTVYVVWRNFDGPDAIYMAKSTDGGKNWSKKPILVAKFNSYDQGTSGASFRTLAFPTIAVSVKGNQSRVHVAWTQRKASVDATPPYACQSANAADCDGRVVIATSMDGGNTWPAPVAVDPPAADPRNPANPDGRGHQLQPALTFSAGKLAITWLDQRLDHTEGVLRCPAGATCTSVNDLEEVREAKGNLDPSCTFPAGLPAPLIGSCFNPAVVWSTYITDGTPGLVRRHTLDTFVATADPELLDFDSTRVSQYVFGSTVAGTVNPDGTLTPERGEYAIRQKEVNPPNLPMFVNGNAAFFGDYIDIAGQLIVATGDPTRPYKYNVGGGANGNFTTSGLAPLFYATFTDNRDVIPPLDGNWSTPTCLAAGLVEDGSGKVTGVDNFKGCATPGYAGNRNQNVYSAMVAESSNAFANANSKLLNASTPRGFVVTVQNISDDEHEYTLTLPAQATGVTAAFNKESFAPGGETAKTTLNVVVQPRSSSTRTVWVTSTVPKAKVVVNVSSAGAGFATQVVLNADPYGVFVTNGDGAATDVVNDDLGNVVLSNAVLTNNVLSNNALTNNVLTNNALTNAVLSNVVLSNAVLSNLQVENAALTNNVLTNNVLSNVVLTNAVLSNNALSNAVLSNVVLSNSALNVALTNLDPANVALSNAVLSNNALTNVALTNNALSNAMLSNAVLSNAALSNVALSNAALSNAVLSNNALSNVALTNAPLSDPSNGTNPDADPLRAIEPASFEVANNEFTTDDLSNSNFRETSFTIRNHGNTDATLAVKLMLRDAVCDVNFVCTTPPEYKLQLILRKVSFMPTAIPPTGPATSTGRAFRIGLMQRNTEVSNIGTLPIISPDDPNLGRFLPDDPRAATLPLAAGEWAYATIRAIGVGGANPPDPEELLRWGVKTVAANASNTGSSLIIRTLSFPAAPAFVALDTPTPAFRTIGGTPAITGTAICSDREGNPILQGTGAPSGTLGDVGNFYIDTTARMVYGPKSLDTGWGSPTPQIGTAQPGDPQTGPKATVACPPEGIVVNPFPLTGDRNATTLSFTPKFWGEFFMLASVADSTGPESKDQQVLRAYVQPRVPVLTFNPLFAADLVYNQGRTLRGLVSSDSANSSAVSQPIVFSASGSCHMAGDGDNLVVDRATIPPNGPPDCVVVVSQLGNEIYAPISVTRSIYIDRAEQAIGFTYLPANDEKVFQNAPFPISAAVTSTTAPASGLAVAFNSQTPGVCTPGGVNGATVTIAGAGTCTIAASQGGDDNYKPAPTLTPSFTIRKANQAITFGPAPSGVTFGDAPVMVSAASSSDSAPPSSIPIVFNSQTTSVCTNVGATVTIVTHGTCTIAANQTFDNNYNAAPEVTQSFEIAKAKLYADASVSPTSITYGDDVAPDAVPIVYGSSPSGPGACLLVPYAATLAGQPPATPADAGTYTISATITSSVHASCDVLHVPANDATLTVDKAPVEFVVDALYFTDLGLPNSITGKLNRPDKPTVYPTAAPTIAAQPAAGTLTSTVPSGTDGAFTADSTPAMLPSDTYTLTFGYTESANFLAATSVTAKLRVEGFSSAGTMTQPRARHRSVLLDDGRVLIVGGFYTNAGAYARSATSEVFCPDTMAPTPTLAQCPGGVGAFSAVGSLHSGSEGHTLTKLLDGKVLKVGGKNAELEIFDPATNAWTLLAAALPEARAFHQATLLTCAGPCAYHGKVLITGGDDGTVANSSDSTLSSTWIFDPATNTLSAGPTMSTRRDAHSATALVDGRVLIAGGEQVNLPRAFLPADDTYTVLSSAEIYDPTLPACGPSTLGCMVSAASMVDARYSDGAVRLADGKVLVAGGSNDFTGQRTGLLASVEIYDPGTNTWSSLAAYALHESRRAHTLTLLEDGWPLAVGGFGPTLPADIKRRASSELFDPGLQQFDLGASLSTARARHRATRLLDGRVLITGGTTDITPPPDFVYRDNAINSAEFYNGPPPSP